MEERRLAATAGELDIPVEELRELMESTTPGLVEAIAGGLVRFEDALLDLSLEG